MKEYFFDLSSYYQHYSIYDIKHDLNYSERKGKSLKLKNKKYIFLHFKIARFHQLVWDVVEVFSKDSCRKINVFKE